MSDTDLAETLVTTAAAAIASKVEEVRTRRLYGNASAEQQIARLAVASVLWTLSLRLNPDSFFDVLSSNACSNLAEDVEQGGEV